MALENHEVRSLKLALTAATLQWRDGQAIRVREYVLLDPPRRIF
jgi:hypothetical protein